MAVIARVPRPVRRVATLLIVAAIVEFFVLPQVAGARRAAHLLGSVNPALVALGLALEVAALLAYFQLTRSLVPRSDRPSLLRMARIELSSLGLSHVVPGGTGPASALAFRLLTEAGVKPTDAGFALATQGLGSAVVLNMILWVALIVSIPLRGTRPLYTFAAGIGVVVFGAFTFLILGLTRAEGRTANLLCRIATHLPFLDCNKVEAAVHRVATRLRELARDPRLLVRAIVWAAANWLLDAASLWVFIAAFGHRTSIDGLLVAYGLANVLAAVPITPGGLGIVEGVLTPTLVGFGVPADIAVLGVVSYRLVNFWLPIPAGGLAYLSLKLEPDDRAGGRTIELGRAVEVAAREAESPRAWAERCGVKRRAEARKLRGSGRRGA
jgi:uncharacterized protein (TIRG00374 family)